MNEVESQRPLDQVRKLIQSKEEELARWRAVFQALSARETGIGSKVSLGGISRDSAV